MNHGKRPQSHDLLTIYLGERIAMESDRYVKSQRLSVIRYRKENIMRRGGNWPVQIWPLAGVLYREGGNTEGLSELYTLSEPDS
jgi:hypothetical protein